MKRIFLGVVLGAIALSGPAAYAQCGPFGCTAGSVVGTAVCDEGNEDCRFCLVSESNPIVCAV